MLEIIGIVVGLKSLWILFAMALARFEGYYQDLTYRYANNHPNLHPLFNIIRGIMLIALTWIAWYNLHIWDTIIFVFTCFFSFSFVHNGILYCTRNTLAPEIYKKRWWANKEKGEDPNKAHVEIEVGFRTAFFVVAIVFLIGIILDALAYDS